MKALFINPSERSVYRGTRFEFKQTQECLPPLTIAVLACILGVVAYRKWALGVLGVLFMGGVIVASVVTRAGVSAADAIPSVLGTAAGLVVLRRLLAPLWGLKEWPSGAETFPSAKARAAYG